jgi:hypothetical protein
MPSRTLEVRITGKDDGARGLFRNAGEDLDAYGKRLDSTGKKMQGWGKKLSIGVTAPLALVTRAAFHEMEEGAAVTAQSNAVIKSTGGIANVTAGHVNELSDSLMRKSGMDDELIHSGENLLLTFKNVRNEVGAGNDVFDRATTAALDLSVAGFGDMTSTSKMLGKALNDPIKGLSAMSRAGVTFTGSQKDAIKAMVESGDILGAQKAILKEVESQVGGSAEAYGETLPGAVGKAREALMNAAGSILSTAGPAFELISSAAEGLAGFLSDLPEPLKLVVGGLAGIAAIAGPVLYVTGGMVRNFSELAPHLMKIATNHPKLLSGFERLGGMATPFLGVAGGLGAIALGAYALTELFGGGLGALSSWENVVDAAGKKSVPKLADEMKKSAQAARDLNDSAQYLRDSFSPFASARIDTTAESHKAFNQVLKNSPEAAQAFIDAVEHSGGKTSWFRERLDEASGSQDRQKQSAKDAAAALIEEGRGAELSAQQITTLKTAGDELLNSQLGLVGAQLNVESATKSYNEAVKNSGIFSLEARQAQLNLTQSYIAQGQAAYDNAMLTSTATSQAGKMKDATEAQRTTLWLLAGGLAAGSPLRVALDEYITSLGRIPPTKSTVISLLATLPQLPAGIAAPRRAAGGPAGGWTTVGERGRETLFFPNGSHVMNAQDRKMAISAGSSGGGDIYLAVSVDPISGRVILEKLVEHDPRLKDALKV